MILGFGHQLALYEFYNFGFGPVSIGWSVRMRIDENGRGTSCLFKIVEGRDFQKITAAKLIITWLWDSATRWLSTSSKILVLVRSRSDEAFGRESAEMDAWRWRHLWVGRFVDTLTADGSLRSDSSQKTFDRASKGLSIGI